MSILYLEQSLVNIYPLRILVFRYNIATQYSQQQQILVHNTVSLMHLILVAFKSTHIMSSYLLQFINYLIFSLILILDKAHLYNYFNFNNYIFKCISFKSNKCSSWNNSLTRVLIIVYMLLLVYKLQNVSGPAPAPAPDSSPYYPCYFRGPGARVWPAPASQPDCSAGGHGLPFL